MLTKPLPIYPSLLEGMIVNPPARGDELWFYVEHEREASSKIFWVSHERGADLKVHFVNQHVKRNGKRVTSFRGGCDPGK
jgi:hypothetical protein